MEGNVQSLADAAALAADKAAEVSETVADAAARAAAYSATLLPEPAALRHSVGSSPSPKRPSRSMDLESAGMLETVHQSLFGDQSTSSSYAAAIDALPSSGVMVPSAMAFAERYCAHCRTLSVVPHPGVLTFMRLHLQELAPEPFRNQRHHTDYLFGDADMYAFCDFVMRDRQPSPVFEHWTMLDASRCSIGYTGVQILMRVLQLPNCRVHTVNLSHQDLGPRGADAVVAAIRANARLTTVKLLGSFIHDQGALQFAQLLEEGCEASRAPLLGGDEAAEAEGSTKATHTPSHPPSHSLEALDLSVNMISYEVAERLQLVCPSEVKLVLRGNRVLDEVLNASSHAIGVILAIIGAVLLGVQVCV